jgi:hypothetical protein
MRWTGQVACMVALRNAYEVWFGKTKGKRSRPRGEREDDINRNDKGIYM